MNVSTPIAAALLLAALSTPLAGQGEPAPNDAAKLAQLLEELRRLPPAAWDARVAELEAGIDARTAAAAELRARAAQLEGEAKAEDARGETLRAELERLRSLRELLGPAPAADMGPRAITYADDIRPLFDRHCVVCHDQGAADGGLDLSSHAAALAGGGSGTTIVPGDPEASRLYLLVAHEERPFMPRKAAKLPDEDIERIRDWIAAGAPENAAAARRTATVVQPAPAIAIAPRFDGPPPMPDRVPAVPLAEVVRPPAIRALDASPRAPLLAVGGHRQVLLLHAESAEVLAVLPFALGEVEVVRFSADGARVLAAGGEAGASGGAVLFDVETGAALGTYGPVRGTALAAAISPDQTLVVLGGPAAKVWAFSTATGKTAWEKAAHDDWVLSLDVDPAGEHLATGSRDGSVKLWECATGRELDALAPKGGAVHALRFGPDGALAVATDGGRVLVHDVAAGKRRWSKDHGGSVQAVAWSHEGELVTAGADGRVRLWSARGGTAARKTVSPEWLYAVAFGGDGRVFAGDWAGQLAVLDAGLKSVEAMSSPARP